MEISRFGKLDDLHKLLLGVKDTDRKAEKNSADQDRRQDQVSISQQAKEVQRIKALVHQPDSQREQRVERLRQAIEGGTYSVKGPVVAEALIRHVLTEAVL
jgi:negative regulator of flagellin synthesis FlgM